MVERSPLVSFALIVAPTLCLTALRIILPVFDDVLSTDLISKIIVYSFSLFIGILMFLKYRTIEDHEYHRSKAISKLSKTYKLDNKGLWEDSDSIIRDLELKAQSNLRGKASVKSDQLMKGSIGNINKEMHEDIAQNEVEINLSSKINSSEQINNENISKDSKSIFSKINEKFNKIIENAALNEVNKNKRVIKSQSYPDIETSETISDKWNTPTSKKERKVIACNYCHSLNDEDVNYCVSCGNYLS